MVQYAKVCLDPYSALRSGWGGRHCFIFASPNGYYYYCSTFMLATQISGEDKRGEGRCEGQQLDAAGQEVQKNVNVQALSKFIH